jgi:hypothetical protein
MAWSCAGPNGLTYRRGAADLLSAALAQLSLSRRTARAQPNVRKRIVVSLSFVCEYSGKSDGLEVQAPLNHTIRVFEKYSEDRASRLLATILAVVASQPQKEG